MDLKIKTLMIAFLFFLVATWINGYICNWVGLTGTGDFLQVLAYSFIGFAIFWYTWNKWGKKFAGT